MKSEFRFVVVCVLAVLGSSGCSNGKPTCNDLLDRIARIDAVAPITDPSFVDIEALTERGIARDQLRAEFVQRGC